MKSSPHSPTKNQSFETLDVQVRGLETDVRDLKDSVVGLNAKFDQAISSISHEVRTAIAGLSNQFTERQRTPWGVLISGAMAIIAVLGVVGNQAIGPITESHRALAARIERMEERIVPRVELQVHWAEAEARERATTLRIQRQWDAQIEIERRLAYHEGQHNPVK